ncbi:MAG: hypothetical protein K2N38_04255 [Oscillospiraceae bacterium]|nr:hypothetical protein [Oscillospiraceae bacterium]
MNKINPIFEALSGVDERHIPVTQEKRPAKKLKITLIAAALAAALTMLAGFTTEAVRGQYMFSFSKENSAEHTFELNITPQEFTVPEEFRPKSGDPHFSGSTDIPPRELFERFGITLPINDNFTEVNDKQSIVEVGILGDAFEVEFRYTLYNKTIDNNVIFTAQYFSKTENHTYHVSHHLLPGEPSEVITLNNGSLCMLTGSRAVFSHNGVHFELEIPYEFEIPANIDQMSIDEQYQMVAEIIEAMPGIETVKQVLIDFGVL